MSPDYINEWKIFILVCKHSYPMTVPTLLCLMWVGNLVHVSKWITWCGQTFCYHKGRTEWSFWKITMLFTQMIMRRIDCMALHWIVASVVLNVLTIGLFTQMIMGRIDCMALHWSFASVVLNVLTIGYVARQSIAAIAGMVPCLSITVTSYWARLLLKSPASRLFIQPFVQVLVKENIKAPCHWPLRGEFTDDGWVDSPHKGPVMRKMFPLDDVIMPTSHCNSFEDRAPVNFIYGCPISKWVAMTWFHSRVPG